MRSVVIIGAGLGGLAAAVRLRHAGLGVTVVEKRQTPGGRCNVLEVDGFRVDTGPTILVMKRMFEETYRAVGRNLDERIAFVPLDPNYRVYYHDGDRLDLYNGMARLSADCERIEPGVTPRLFRFLGEAAHKYELGMRFVERNYDRLTDLANPLAAMRLWRTRACGKLYTHVGRFFRTEKLRQAFSFHSMFLGLSPMDALAMYALITYADLGEGMYYPLGGVYRLVEDLVALANEMGVTLRTGTPVTQILVRGGRACGVRLETGEELMADAVVSNADLVYTYKQLVPPQNRKVFTDERLDGMRFACSGYLLYLGIDRTYPGLTHQGIYFSADYRANLDAIFRTKTIPNDPSFHLNVPTVTDRTLAPEGNSILYLLAPMPNLQGNVNWDEAAPRVREALLGTLERLIDPDIRRHIVWQREYRPTDWQRDINAPYGTAFGSLAHDFFQSSYFRPHNVARDIPGLYFVGQATYPGIGMPMVMISARLVVERLLAQ